jgi:hypothetical protein
MVSAAESDVWIVGIGGGIPGAGEIETPAAISFGGMIGSHEPSAPRIRNDLNHLVRRRFPHIFG